MKNLNAQGSKILEQIYSKKLQTKCAGASLLKGELGIEMLLSERTFDIRFVRMSEKLREVLLYLLFQMQIALL